MHRLTFHRRPIAALVGACLFAGLVLAGCGEDFAPRSLVNKTRILAVKADNPRLLPGEFARLSALVVSPDEDDDIDRRWEFCPFTQNDQSAFRCDWPEETPPELIEALRGDGRTFDFIYPPQLGPLLDEFCAQSAAIADQLPPGVTPPDCGQAGFPGRVRLEVTNNTTGETWISVKTLYLIPPSLADEVQENANPEIASFGPTTEGEQLVVGEKLELTCQVDIDGLEQFQGANDDAPRSEEIQLAWFVRDDRMTIEDDVTLLSFEFDTVEDAQNNEVEVEEPGDYTAWCVIRDGRGGTDWASVELTALPAP